MASTKITRTPSSNGNQKTWTWSAWIKNNGASGDATYQYLMEANYGNQARYTYICLRHGTIETYGGDYQTSNSQMSFDVSTTRLLRDPSAWYHIVVAMDTTQGTSTDRLKIYINGVQETSFQGYVGSGASATFPAQNDVTFFNVTTTENSIGNAFDGNMAHVHFVDGAALTPATFGETDSTSGIWKPKASPSGITYGTNGFFLKFENSGNLDLDSSGNNLTFATTGTLTQNLDTPSNNFCTMNPLASYYSASTFTNGNNTVTTTSGAHDVDTSTLAVGAGLWYYEAKLLTAPDGNCLIGIQSQPQVDGELGEDTYSYGLMCSNGNIIGPSSASASYGVSVSAGDVVGVYIDLTANKLYFAKAGVIMNSGTGFSIVAPASQTTLPAATNVYFPACGDASSSSAFVWQFNFGSGYFGTTAVTSAVADAGGEGLFEYDPSAGTFDSASKDFRAICTKNIKEFG